MPSLNFNGMASPTFLVTKRSRRMSRAWTDILVRTKQRTKDTRFGTWNVRSLCRARSLTAAARELARYKLDLVCVQEVRWDDGGRVRAHAMWSGVDSQVREKLTCSICSAHFMDSLIFTSKLIKT